MSDCYTVLLKCYIIYRKYTYSTNCIMCNTDEDFLMIGKNEIRYTLNDVTFFANDVTLVLT